MTLQYIDHVLVTAYSDLAIAYTIFALILLHNLFLVAVNSSSKYSRNRFGGELPRAVVYAVLAFCMGTAILYSLK